MISVRNLEFFRLGNCSLSRNKGLASISFFSSTSIIALADFVSPYLDSCSFSLIIQSRNHLLRNPETTRPRDNNDGRPHADKKKMALDKLALHLKFSKVKSCVISLKSSSLKDAKTFKSLTKISTALDRSCLAGKQRNPPVSKELTQAVKYHKRCATVSTYLSRASRYFCLRISKNIFIE